MKYQRSFPYFQALLGAKNKNKTLKAFPSFVVDDIVEILYNVTLGNAKLSSKQKQTCFKFRTPLTKLVNAKSKLGRRKIVYNQKGGFLPALLPLIPSIIGAIGGITSAAINSTSKRS